MKIHILYSYINLRGANTPIEITYRNNICEQFCKNLLKIRGLTGVQPPSPKFREGRDPPTPPPRFGAPVIHTYLSNKINKYLMFYT